MHDIARRRRIAFPSFSEINLSTIMILLLYVYGAHTGMSASRHISHCLASLGLSLILSPGDENKSRRPPRPASPRPAPPWPDPTRPDHAGYRNGQCTSPSPGDAAGRRAHRLGYILPQLACAAWRFIVYAVRYFNFSEIFISLF